MISQLKSTGIPNLLTLSRLLLLGPVAAAVFVEKWTAACILFIIAALTDWLDGWTARRFGWTSETGVYLDPLVDKVVANVLLGMLAVRFPDWVSPALFIPLLAREFVVQGFRSIAPCKGVLIRTGFISKCKFAFQAACLACVLAGQAFGPGVGRTLLRSLSQGALGLALITGLVSMILILERNADIWERPAVDLERR